MSEATVTERTADEPRALETLLQGFRRRALADEALRWSLRAVIAAGAWGIVLSVAARIWPIERAAQIWDAGAVALVLSALIGWVRSRPDLAHVARTADARLGLAERLASALAFAGDPAELPAMLRADALARASARRPGDAYPAGRHRPSALVAGTSALALIVLASLSNPMDSVLAKRRADQAAVNTITSQLKKTQEQLKAAEGSRPTDQQKAIDKALNDALKKLGAASSPRQALESLAALNDKLQSLDNPSTAGQAAGAAAAGAALGTSPAGEALGGALSAGQLAVAADQAKQLATALSGLTPDQRTQLAQALADAATSAGDTPLGNALAQGGAALSAGDVGGAQQALNQAAGAMSSLAQQQAGEQSLGQAQAALQQSLQQANQAASQGSQGQGQGQGSGNGSGSGGAGTGSGVGSGGGSGGSGSAGSPSEKVYVPKTGAAPGTEPLPAGPLGPGQTVPQTGYQSVLGSYSQVELNALNQTVLPPSERDLVQQYFAGLDQQGTKP